jgi:hypothetical protein
VNKKLIFKMIQKGFVQYNHPPESLPLTEQDYEELFEAVCSRVQNEAESDLHDIIQDLVYDYLTEKGAPW